MDRFSELVAKGVAQAPYTQTLPQVDTDPVCRTYNNIFSIVTDTHMACQPDGSRVITGHIINDTRKFDRFLWSGTFNGVTFFRKEFWSCADWLAKCGLMGHYETINCELAYVVTPIPTDIKMEPTTKESVSSYVTNECAIPQNSRWMSTHTNIYDVYECVHGDIFETAKAMNESKCVHGDKWIVAGLSDGNHLVCPIGNKIYML